MDLQPREVLEQWVAAIESEALDKLNDWEKGFFFNIKYSVSRFGRLTQKQQDILERIYAEYTS